MEADRLEDGPHPSPPHSDGGDDGGMDDYDLEEDYLDDYDLEDWFGDVGF